ncbi:MAG TPA: nuclear transport factor 2 family protein [Thermoanaerobaculia bacterium]|nr:nuclear transport factor 2 family protein [Thermoanaerobaculia bacterium]
MKPVKRGHVLLFLLSIALPSCASTRPQSPSELIAIEHQWVRAIQHHDKSFLDGLLADDFVDSTFRGSTRSKLDVLNGPRAAGKYKPIRLDDLRVRFYAATAVVTGVNVLQDRGDASRVVRVRFTDVFVKQAGRWRAVSAQETVATGT